MSKKVVTCKVLGHGDGPECSSCKKPMDSIQVETASLVFKEKKTFYCYYCSKFKN